MATNPLSLVVLVSEYLIIFAFIFSAFMFARGKSSEGIKWFKNAIILALALVAVPSLISLIFTGSPNATTSLNNLQVPNYYIGVDTGAATPHAAPVQTVNGIAVQTVNLTYTYGIVYNMSAIFVNFGASGTTSRTVIIQGFPTPVTIPGTIQYVIVIGEGANELKNDGVQSNLNTTATITNFIDSAGLLKISYTPDDKEHVAAFTIYAAYVDSNNNTVTFAEQVISVTVTATKNEVQGGGGGLGGVIAKAFADIVNKIIGIFKAIGTGVTDLLPTIQGQRIMLFFVLMPTDDMVYQSSQFVHTYYYNKAIPIGMTLLIITTLLAFIESLWNGSNDVLIPITKKFIGVVIWMLGGYYFYMAFANIIDGIILYIGLNGILWFGGLLNALYGMIVLFGIATMVVSNNVTGTALGMVMGVLYLFSAFAVFKFFIILAVVAMFPIIAPFSMVGYGPDIKSVISKMVDMGILGILITATLQFMYLANKVGGGLLKSISSLIAIYLMFAPSQIHSFLGGLAKGESLSFENAFNTAGMASGALSTSVKSAGLGAAGAGIAAKKIASRREKPGSGPVGRIQMSFNRIRRIRESRLSPRQIGTNITKQTEKTKEITKRAPGFGETKRKELTEKGEIGAAMSEATKQITKNTSQVQEHTEPEEEEAPEELVEEKSQTFYVPEKAEERLRKIDHTHRPLAEFLDKYKDKNTLDELKHYIKASTAAKKMYEAKAKEHEKVKDTRLFKAFSTFDSITSGFHSAAGSNTFMRTTWSGIHSSTRKSLAEIYRKIAQDYDKEVKETIEKVKALEHIITHNEEEIMQTMIERYQSMRLPLEVAEKYAKEDVERLKEEIRNFRKEIERALKEGESLFPIKNNKPVFTTKTARKEIEKHIQKMLKQKVVDYEDAQKEIRKLISTKLRNMREELDEAVKKVEENFNPENYKV